MVAYAPAQHRPCLFPKVSKDLQRAILRSGIAAAKLQSFRQPVTKIYS
jgi:hypothetical protein